MKYIRPDMEIVSPVYILLAWGADQAVAKLARMKGLGACEVAVLDTLAGTEGARISISKRTMGFQMREARNTLVSGPTGLTSNTWQHLPGMC